MTKTKNNELEKFHTAELFHRRGELWSSVFEHSGSSNIGLKPDWSFMPEIKWVEAEIRRRGIDPKCKESRWIAFEDFKLLNRDIERLPRFKN